MKKIIMTAALLVCGMAHAEECTKIPECFGSDHKGQVVGSVEYKIPKGNSEYDEKKFSVECTAYFGVKTLTEKELVLAEYWADCSDDHIRDGEKEFAREGNDLYFKKADGTPNFDRNKVGEIDGQNIHLNYKLVKKDVPSLKINNPVSWQAQCFTKGIVKFDLEQTIKIDVIHSENSMEVNREYAYEKTFFLLGSIPEDIYTCSQLKNYLRKENYVGTASRILKGTLNK